MQAIILAGGFGTRLREVVSYVPKPLAPVAGRPFMAWLLEAMAAQGVTGATLSVHHQWEKIHDYFERHPPPMPIAYAVEPAPFGTGGAMAFALRRHAQREPVIVLNGDSFTDVDLRALYAQHTTSGAMLTMALRDVADTGRYGEVMTKEGVVTSFAPGQAGHGGLINAGIYVMPPDMFARFPMPEAFSFERDFLPPHLAALAPRSYVAGEYFIDIGIPEDYRRAQVEIPKLLERA